MSTQELSLLARELQESLVSGSLAQRGRVDLSDGVTVTFERMARIVLADFDRLMKQTPDDPISDDAEQQLYDDLLRLHDVAHAGVTGPVAEALGDVSQTEASRRVESAVPDWAGHRAARR